MEQERKYEFTGETRKVRGSTLNRIRALRDFADVKAGELGGWIEKEDNLSHEGTAWVSGNAKVCRFAKVQNDARVYDNAQVYGDACISGKARVFGDARVSDNAQVYGDARVYGNALVHGDAQVSGDARVFGDAEVYGDSQVYGDALVHGDAQIEKTTDYLTVGAIGSRDDTTTFFRDRDLGVTVACGCFLGTLDAFEQKVNEVHGNDRHGKVYAAAIALARAAMEGEEDDSCNAERR